MQPFEVWNKVLQTRIHKQNGKVDYAVHRFLKMVSQTL